MNTINPGTPSASLQGTLRAGRSRPGVRRILSREVSARLGIPQGQARATLDALLDTIAQNLMEGSNVEIRGWGVFFLRHRKARGGVRNPRTLEPCPPLPSRRTVRFRAYRGFVQ